MKTLIDHVTVCGSDLERMRSGFAAIGLETEYGGAHANGLTHMALVGFEDGSYVELIAPVKGGDGAKATGMMAGWMPLMLGDAGGGAWAIRAPGIQGRVDELRERGIDVRGPERGGRAKPDGMRLEWETAVVGSGAAGAVLPFMIEDRTERELRVRAGSNLLGVDGVAAVVIGVRELGTTIDLFRRAYGWEGAEVEEHSEFAARLGRFTGTPVILAEALTTGSWLSKRLEKFGESPVGFLFSGVRIEEVQPSWFGKRVQWLEEGKIGAKVGLIEE
jgi:Glyoxalase-like domain